jgi:hypothetical protein
MNTPFYPRWHKIKRKGVIIMYGYRSGALLPLLGGFALGLATPRPFYPRFFFPRTYYPYYFYPYPYF